MLRMLVALLIVSFAGMAIAEDSVPTSRPTTTRSVDRNTVRLPRFPAVSPDGQSIAFAWHGDVWLAPTAGGHARRLTVDPYDDAYPAFSPDGAKIAFTSERVGGGNLLTMNVDGTDVRQVTTTDRYLQLNEWADGKLWVSARLEPDVFPGGRSYAIDADGGDPTRAFDAFGTTPAVSPDGSKILFTRGASAWSRRGYRGSDARDVWLYDRAQKSYRRLSDWPGNDGRPRWVDDQTYVYASDREDGTTNLYLARLDDAAGLGSVRLTHAVGTDVEEFGVSRDGRTLVYAQWARLYRLDLTTPGAAATPIDLDAEQDATAARTQYRAIDRAVTDAALSPDGKTLAAIAFGQVWVRGVEPHSATRLVDARFTRCRDLAWSPDGAWLYYASDVNGHDAIHMASVELSRNDVKRAATQLAMPATTQVAWHGRPARDDLPTTSSTTQANHGRDGRATQPTTSLAFNDVSDVLNLLSRTEEGVPEVFTNPTTQPTTFSYGPTTLPATTQAAPVVQPTTAPATARAASQPAAAYANRWPDALRFRVESLVDSGLNDRGPSPSPDGKSLAFQRGNGQLWIRDLASGRERLLFDGWSDALEWQWRGDSRQIAFVTEDRNNNRDVFLVPADGSRAPTNISKHPDNDYSPRYSADGKVLVFLSQRADNSADVYRVFLDRELETLRGTDLDAYYKEAGEAAKRRERPKPTTVRPSTRPSSWHERPAHDSSSTTSATTSATTQAEHERGARATKPDAYDDAYLRVTKLTSLPGEEGDLAITPAGDRIVFTAQNSSGTGRSTLTLYRDGEPQRIQGEVSVRDLTFEGDRAVVVSDNRTATMNVANGELQYVDVSARLGVDRRALFTQVFEEAARTLGEQYYDATMHGLDWPSVTRRYQTLIDDCATPGEFDHVANKLIGELNGSHLGIDMPAPANPNAINVGRLGARLTRVADGYRVDVFPNGPSATGAMRLVVGDVIVAVEGQAFDSPTRTLDAAMANRIGIETLIRVRRGEREFDVLLTPTSADAEATIAYEAWRNATAKRVNDLSKGRLGYIHLRGMDEPSLETFERDLFAAADGRDGLIIDVRNNGGGWTTDRLLASILAPVHAYTRQRGFAGDAQGAYPQDRLFIQRYTLPMAMLCNEKSFSNAEIVAHAFQTLKRGTLIGQTTAGGVISTGGTRLLDGTTVRLPNRGWFLPDGTNMELHGAVPDVIVPMRPEDEATNDDVQVWAAVDDLLKRLDAHD